MEELTVAQLIAELQKLPQSLPVIYWLDSAPRGPVARAQAVRRKVVDWLDDWDEAVILSSKWEGPEDDEEDYQVINA